MKTINTTLPIYKSLSRQCYQRALLGGNDKPVPTISPVHRLPSMQWDIDGDTAGDINSMFLVDIKPQPMVTGWTNHGGASQYSTFITDGSKLVSVIGAFAGGYAQSNNLIVKKGENYIITINLTLNVGAYLEFRSSGIQVTNAPTTRPVNLYNGVNIIPCRAAADATNAYIWLWDSVGAIDFSATISIEKESLDRYFGLRQSYLAAPYWTNTGYDTFDLHAEWYSAIKTTAPDVDYVTPTFLNAFDVTVGDIFRFVIVLRLNSGTAPKVVIVDSGGVDISNIVTLKDGINYIILTATDTDAVSALRIRNDATEVSNYMLVLGYYFYKLQYQPLNTSDELFKYSGQPLRYALPYGKYYLKFTTTADYVYYSDLVAPSCVYENLNTEWTNSGYETFTSVGSEITSAINTAGTGIASGDTFDVIKGEKIRVIFYLNLISGDVPDIALVNDGWTLADSDTLVNGLNDIELIPTWTGEASIRIYNTTNASYNTSEVFVLRNYSEKFLTINFSNSCDLGDIDYTDFDQTLWIETEVMEPVFPYTEKGQENGDGEFVPAWQRSDKLYQIRTKLIPQYIVDVLHRLKVHNSVTMIDIVGDEFTVEQIDTEHEWHDNDKYYAIAVISADLGEGVVNSGCCD